MIEAAARIHAVEISSFSVRDDAEVEQAIETFAREPNGGLIPLPSTLIATHREFIISLAARHRLPIIYAYRYYPANGGLASYGADNLDGHRREADYVDRILKGEKPADLPVQFPTKYQLVINLNTAKALGLSIAPSLLAAADPPQQRRTVAGLEEEMVRDRFGRQRHSDHVLVEALAGFEIGRAEDRVDAIVAEHRSRHPFVVLARRGQ